MIHPIIHHIICWIQMCSRSSISCFSDVCFIFFCWLNIISITIRNLIPESQWTVFLAKIEIDCSILIKQTSVVQISLFYIDDDDSLFDKHLLHVIPNLHFKVYLSINFMLIIITVAHIPSKLYQWVSQFSVKLAMF